MIKGLAEEVKIMRRTRLKLGVLRFVQKGLHGFRYLHYTREAFPWATDEEFYSVVTDLRESGQLTESSGRDGGKKIRVVQTETKEAVYGK